VSVKIRELKIDFSSVFDKSDGNSIFSKASSAEHHFILSNHTYLNGHFTSSVLAKSASSAVFTVISGMHSE
jgi:hypothetical protein